MFVYEVFLIVLGLTSTIDAYRPYSGLILTVLGITLTSVVHKKINRIRLESITDIQVYGLVLASTSVGIYTLLAGFTGYTPVMQYLIPVGSTLAAMNILGFAVED